MRNYTLWHNPKILIFWFVPTLHFGKERVYRGEIYKTMKKTTKIISSAISLFVATMPLCGFAGEINCSLNGRNISLSGIADSDDAYVSGFILPQSKYNDKISAKDINNENVLAFSAEKNNNTFSKSLGLPEDLNAGEYVVYIFENNEKIAKNFVYCGDNLNELSAQIANMNGDQIYSAVLSNKNILGIDEKQCAAFASFIADSNKSLKDAYSEAYVVSIIKSGDTSSALACYGYAYGIDYETGYKTLKPAVKLDLDQKLKSEKITDLKSDYQRLLKDAVLSNIETKDELKELVLSGDLNLDEYNALSETNKNAVINKLFNNLPDNMENLKADFKKYCSDASSSGSSNSGNGGGGGSSGGKSSGGAMSGSALGTVSGIGKGQTPPVFSDTASHWAKAYIDTLSSKKIISGYENGMFYPDKNVTRAEFSKMIALAMDIRPDTASASVFHDVSDKDWYKPYVTAMAKNGLINGYNGFFNPDDYITREDMAVIIYRVLKYKGYAMNSETEFADIISASDYTLEAIAKLGGSRIITGSENNFRPKDMSTRAETATVLARILTAF